MDMCFTGTECTHAFQTRARPLRFVVYDKHVGGIGIAAGAFLVADQLLGAALRLVESCPCDDGCPGCIHDLRCSGHNLVMDKAATRVILRDALDMPLLDVSPSTASATATHEGTHK